jgi:hypothetical protein
MTHAGEQLFPGSSHQVRFLFQPSTGAAETLCVVFADASQEPVLQFVRELAPLDLPKLFVLDDFGPYAGEAGYPGCWYLGEGRRLTMAEDVGSLIDHARSVLGLAPRAIVATGYGAGGFAALHLGARQGWGRVIAGSPQTRLGAHLVADLAEVATFVAGGTAPVDYRWLDGVLYESIATADALPEIEVVAEPRNHGRHVLPLIDAVKARGRTVESQLLPAGEAPGVAQALFASHLIDRLAEAGGASRSRVEFSDDPADHASRWSRLSRARVTRVEDGVRCFAPAVGNHEKGVYAGLRFLAGPLETVRIEMTVRRPHELESILVDAAGAGGERVARWQWLFERDWPPSSGRLTLLLTPASEPPITTTISGDTATADALDVFVKVRNERSADFTVHSIDVFAAAETPPPAGLPLPTSARQASGARMLRDPAHTARQVAELAAEGVFPPPALLPELSPRRPRLKVACLLDRFSELGFGYEFDYVDFTPEDYREVIDREQPQMLLVESIWRGKDEAWNKLMVPDTEGSGPTEPVRELIAHCRRKGIPTVFWNKEDPPNFDHFVKTAALCDYIFTTDESCVPRYRAVVGHDRIGVLPFSAQPALHNPIGAPVPRPLDIAFLGTFYGRKHAARKRQMEMILDPAREYGVHIYSRVEASGGYAFPEKYQPHLIGTVPYEQVLGAYRNYKVLLNVNSVPDSRTMCARRVFEILGCGGIVVSGPSPALEATLGAGVVYESDSYRHTKEVLGHLLGNDALRDRIAVEGIRRIHRGHTYSDRVNAILEVVGLPTGIEPQPITVVAPALDAEVLERTIDSVLAQTRRPDSVILVGPEPDQVPRAQELLEAGVELIAVPGEPGGPDATVLAPGVAASNAELFAYFAPDAIYGAHFLEDLENAHGYTRADIVGKAAHYRMDEARGWTVIDRREEENRLVEAVEPASILASRHAFARVPIGRSEDLVSWQRRCSGLGLSVYAADRFNFVARTAEESMTWTVPSTVEAFGPGAQHALA